MILTVYELQDQIKELLKRVEELEEGRCLCTTCQTRDFLRTRHAKEQIDNREEM